MAQWFNWRGLFSRRRKRIEISVETRESWQVCRFKESITELCPLCRAETIFIPLDSGVRIFQSDVYIIENLIKTGKVHFRQSADMEKLICLFSLQESTAENSTKKYLIKKREFMRKEIYHGQILAFSWPAAGVSVQARICPRHAIRSPHGKRILAFRQTGKILLTEGD